MSARLVVVVAIAGLLAAGSAAAFNVGADLSSLPRVEANGATFHDRRGPADALALLRRNGFTSVRLRLWNAPADGDCGLGPTLAMARRAHAAGMSVLLDLHLSDTWADPGHQTPPAAWKGLEGEALARTAGAYARGVVEAFVAQGTPPAMVQIGNEIDDGVLWEAARLGPGAGSPKGIRELALVIFHVSRGVRAACPGARIVLHFSAGGHAPSCERVLDPLVAAGVQFDAIGVSYYPWWQGTFDDLGTTLETLAQRYHRDVMVLETAYPWTLRALDAENNIVGSHDQLAEGCAASPEGQAAFARKLRRAVDQVPEGRGVGVWWWEPAWVATPRGSSPWENCALFDSSGALLPAAKNLAH